MVCNGTVIVVQRDRGVPAAAAFHSSAARFAADRHTREGDTLLLYPWDGDALATPSRCTRAGTANFATCRQPTSAQPDRHAAHEPLDGVPGSCEVSSVDGSVESADEREAFALCSSGDPSTTGAAGWGARAEARSASAPPCRSTHSCVVCFLHTLNVLAFTYDRGTGLGGVPCYQRRLPVSYTHLTLPTTPYV